MEFSKVFQWTPEITHDAVTLLVPSIYIVGELAYLNNVSPLPKCWLTLEPISRKPTEEEIIQSNDVFGPVIARFDGYFRKILPFNQWSIKGPSSEIPIEDNAAFVADFMQVSQAMYGAMPEKPMGKLPNGGCVCAGDWLVEFDGGIKNLGNTLPL